MEHEGLQRIPVGVPELLEPALKSFLEVPQEAGCRFMRIGFVPAKQIHNQSRNQGPR